jgi:hypothetical protein
VNTFIQKCNSTHDFMSSLLYNPWRTHIDFHHPILMSMLTLLWMVTLSPSQLPPFCLSTLFVLHILLLHSFVLLRFFNEHQIYYCSFWSFLITCTSTSSMSTQKFNYRCSNFIYIVNYCMHFPIVRFAFFTF